MNEQVQGAGAPREEALPFFLLLLLLAVGLVFHLYAAGQGILQALFSTLRMLLLEDSASRGDFQQHGADAAWWLYEVLRIAVPTVASWLLIKGYLHLIGSSGNWVWAWLNPHDVLILGDGPLAGHLAQEHRRQQPGKRVALLTQTPDSPTHSALRRQGVKVFGGSALSPGNLRWLAAHKVAVVYVLADTDADNLTILSALMAHYPEVKASTKAPPQTCLVHVSDDFLAARIAETDWHQRSGQRCQVRVFNAWKSSAKKLVSNDTHSPHKNTKLGHSPHVLMLGFSSMGRCVLEQLARLGHYPDGRKARLSIVAPDAATIQAQVHAIFPALEPAPNDVTPDNKPVIDVGFITAPVAGLKAQALRECTPISVAYICCASLEEGITAMHALLMAAPEQTFPIVLCAQEDIAPELRQAIVALDRCHVFDTLQHGLGLEQGEPMLNEFAEREAAQVHLYFSNKMPDGPVDRIPQEWLTAEEWQRESSRDAVRHLNVKQHYFSKLSAQDEKLRRLEHQRWCAERLLLGWRHAQTTDRDLRLHKDLQPFDKLDREVQEKDATIVTISDLLAQARPTRS